MINFLYTSPKPKLDGTDAVVNEINSLQTSFGGFQDSLFPLKNPSSKYPRFLFGLHSLKGILEAEKNAKYNHIFSSGLFYMPFIHALKKPTFLSLTAGINNTFKPPSKKYLSNFKSIVVSNERDFKILQNLGLRNISLIRTGINTSKFESSEVPLQKNLNLLMASAPWEISQFESKGIHLLLDMLKNTTGIKLTFLWRNVLPTHMIKLIEEYGVQNKVQFINRFVDTNQYFKKVHGTILLCNDSQVVKAYPHSLIESLITSKPVIVSNEIPIADYIQNNKCGVVLDSFEKDKLHASIENFKNNYSDYTKACKKLNKDSFSQERLIEDYKKLYKNIYAL